MAKSIYLEKNGDHLEYIIWLLPEDDKKSVSVDSEILSKKAFKDVDSVENVFFTKCICIEDSAFENCKELKSVIWKENDSNKETESIHGINISSVKELTIQHGAFKNCSKLQTVILPKTENITIEKDAFDGCNLLRVVVALSSKLKITENPFEDCPEDLVFICNSNSDIKQFARENGYRYIDV